MSVRKNILSKTNMSAYNNETQCDSHCHVHNNTLGPQMHNISILSFPDHYGKTVWKIELGACGSVEGMQAQPN